MGWFFIQNRFMGLMRGSFGFWRVEKSSPARITVGMGRTILCVFLSFMLGGIYIRVVLGNEILLTNTNPQCKGSKKLIIEQIYFLWAYFFYLRLCCKLEDEDDLEDLNY